MATGERGFPTYETFLTSSANLYRIITLPFATLQLIDSISVLGQVHSPAMLETWLRESRVRLPALVMLETWLRESGLPA